LSSFSLIGEYLEVAQALAVFIYKILVITIGANV